MLLLCGPNFLEFVFVHFALGVPSANVRPRRRPRRSKLGRAPRNSCPASGAGLLHAASQLVHLGQDPLGLLVLGFVGLSVGEEAAALVEVQ